MSVIPGATILACHRNATESRALEKRISSVILNVYQSTRSEKDDDSGRSLENHAKIDEIRRFSNKKFDSSHDGAKRRKPRSAGSISMFLAL